MTGLRRARSSQTPMNGPNTSAGANCAAPRNPIWAALACRVSAAARGIASRLNWVPNSETLWPAQNLRKSGCRHSGETLASATGPTASTEGEPRRTLRDHTSRAQQLPEVLGPSLRQVPVVEVVLRQHLPAGHPVDGQRPPSQHSVDLDQAVRRRREAQRPLTLVVGRSPLVTHSAHLLVANK